MTVVRTLTTNLDFNVDFKALKTFNTALDRFSLKFALGGTAAAAFAYQVVAAIGNVTNLVLETDNLARTTGIAFEEINNLTKAATTLGRIDAKGFQAIFKTVNKDVVDARLGLGRLRQIAAGLNATGIQFDIFDDQGKIADTLTIFERMVNAVKQIPDEQLRIRAFSDLFQADGGELDKIFKDGYAAFKSLADTFTPISKALKESEGFSETYRQNVQEISSSLEQVLQTFVVTFSPVILKLTEALVTLLEVYDKIFKAIGSAAESVQTGQNPLGYYGRGLLPDDTWSPAPQTMNAPIQVENVFQVTLQPGTPQEQGRQLYEATTSALSGWFENQVQNVMSNNPQVE